MTSIFERSLERSELDEVISLILVNFFDLKFKYFFRVYVYIKVPPRSRETGLYTPIQHNSCTHGEDTLSRKAAHALINAREMRT